MVQVQQDLKRLPDDAVRLAAFNVDNKTTPQASCSNCGSYNPCFHGNPVNGLQPFFRLASRPLISDPDVPSSLSHESNPDSFHSNRPTLQSFIFKLDLPISAERPSLQSGNFASDREFRFINVKSRVPRTSAAAGRRLKVE